MIHEAGSAGRSEGITTMSSTVSHHHSHVSHRAPFLASAAVLGVIAVGAIAVVTVEQNAGGASPSAPAPPAVSYPGSSVFDNQPTGLSRPGQ